MTPCDPDTQRVQRREAWGAPLYFGVYFCYLFLNQESELLHWVSLVAIPLGLIWLTRQGEHRTLGAVLASVGLRRGHLLRGLGWAILAGLAVSALQLLLSRRADEIWQLLRSGRVLILLPLSFVLMFVTAGFTEEFFFRGVLQTRLESLLRSRLGAIVGASVLFGLYHLPYAYCNPRWPSAGDCGAAWSLAMGQGVPAGVVLGFVYYASKRNLPACAVTHALINAPPAMTMIRFGGQ